MTPLTATARLLGADLTCTCEDADLDRLRDLIRQGHGQAEASRIIWGTPTTAAPPVQHDLLRDQVQRIVVDNRRRFPRLFARGR